MTLGIALLFFLTLADGALAGLTIEEAAKALDGLSARERVGRVESEARKEGRVRWSTSTPVTWAEPILQAFKKRYPAIPIEFNRLSGRVLAERLIREYRAGKYDIDVLQSGAVTFWGIKEAGVIGSYRSPETAGAKSDMKDAKGLWAAPYSNVPAIVCNKNRVKAAPKDWKEFTDPKWKGDFSIDTERFQWFYALQRIYGEEEGKRLLSGYVQNGVQVRRGGTLQAQLVAAGEYSCALAVYLESIYLLLKAGAPVVYSVPEPVLLRPTIIMMGKYPPHPYAAILLYDYLMSSEGLSQFTRNNALAPSRGDLPMVNEIKLLQGRPAYFIDVEETSRDYKKISEGYQSLLKK